VNSTSLQHIAIIMDGNGRWATQKGLKRTAGHEEGAKVVREITQYSAKLGIKYLTLYAFSTENWKRPKIEVNFLLKLLHRYLHSELQVYLDNNIRFKFIGDISPFPKNLQELLVSMEQQTAHCNALTQVLALNYGAQDEIARAVKQLIKTDEKIDTTSIENYLDTTQKGIPAVDLLIRTSGEMRVSNFLLWQISYAEMFFTQTLWPDFSTNEFESIIEQFSVRERRFGAI
jgi:undecaprenyl diphosphate synthase